MRDEAEAPVARQVLAVGLDQVLRLLHPFVPFITEQLWSYLNEQAPKRGVTEEMAGSDLCVLAPWPSPWEAWEDQALEEEFEQLKQVIGRLRELRSRYQVPPSRELPAAVKTSGDMLTLLEEYGHLIRFMARLSGLSVGTEVVRPKNAASQVVGDMEIFLGDVLDPEKERARLETQKKKLTKQLEASKKKLANPNFLEKAPAEVVEEEKTRVSDLTGEIALLEKNLQVLDG
jgi:valyl-tRNA synthetase